MRTKKEIIIEMIDGCVNDVRNLPKGYSYRIKQLDKYGDEIDEDDDFENEN